MADLDKIRAQLLEVATDIRGNANISFRVFLFANYSNKYLKMYFAELCEYVDLDLTDEN